MTNLVGFYEHFPVSERRLTNKKAGEGLFTKVYGDGTTGNDFQDEE